MLELGASEAGVDALAAQHDVPADAIVVLLRAIRHGGGRQAQFSHPALGGMGQWSRGGGTMIGDMFNRSLKTKVEQICNSLAQTLADDHLSRSGASAAPADWWPDGLGQPSSAGSQHEQRYAYFPATRRLVIKDNDGVRVYDAGEHRISGVSQWQGDGHHLHFTSQLGSVNLSDLALIDDGADHREPLSPAHHSQPEPRTSDVTEAAPVVESAARGSADILTIIQRLHDLLRNGVLTDEEFSAKKAELLARL